MRVELISDSTLLPLSKEEWNDLAGRSATSTPFQTYEWFISWWSVFGNSNTLLLLLVYRENRLVGLAPFMIVHNGNNKELRFISDTNADYCDFIVEEHDKKEFLITIVHYLVTKRSSWKSIYLRNIPQHSKTPSILQELLPGHNLFHTTTLMPCPVLQFHREQSTPPWQASKTLRRHFNFFNKSGELSFHIFTSSEEALQTIDSLFEQHIARWSSVQKASLFLDRRYQDFYKELLIQAMPTGWIFFSCLYFNKQSIAYHFGFDYNSKVIWYKPSFNISFHNRSPGKVLLKFLIEYCIQNQKEELDFTLGDEPFKRHYTNHVRFNSTMHIFDNKWNYYKDTVLRRLIKVVKKVYRP